MAATGTRRPARFAAVTLLVLAVGVADFICSSRLQAAPNR